MADSIPLLSTFPRTSGNGRTRFSRRWSLVSRPSLAPPLIFPLPPPPPPPLPPLPAPLTPTPWLLPSSLSPCTFLSPTGPPPAFFIDADVMTWLHRPRPRPHPTVARDAAAVDARHPRTASTPRRSTTPTANAVGFTPAATTTCELISKQRLEMFLLFYLSWKMKWGEEEKRICFHPSSLVLSERFYLV